MSKTFVFIKEEIQSEREQSNKVNVKHAQLASYDEDFVLNLNSDSQCLRSFFTQKGDVVRFSR